MDPIWFVDRCQLNNSVLLFNHGRKVKGMLFQTLRVRSRITLVVAACVLGLALAIAQAVFAAAAPQPGPGTQKVTFCHAIPPASAKNGWNKITTSVMAFYNAGHPNHGADIVPPFSYLNNAGEVDDYPGNHWDTAGEAIFNNGCKAVQETPPSAAQPVVPVVHAQAGPCVKQGEATGTVEAAVTNPSEDMTATDYYVTLEDKRHVAVSTELVPGLAGGDSASVLFSGLPAGQFSVKAAVVLDEGIVSQSVPVTVAQCEGSPTPGGDHGTKLTVSAVGFCNKAHPGQGGVDFTNHNEGDEDATVTDAVGDDTRTVTVVPGQTIETTIGPLGPTTVTATATVEGKVIFREEIDLSECTSTPAGGGGDNGNGGDNDNPKGGHGGHHKPKPPHKPHQPAQPPAHQPSGDKPAPQQPPAHQPKTPQPVHQPEQPKAGPQPTQPAPQQQHQPAGYVPLSNTAPHTGGSDGIGGTTLAGGALVVFGGVAVVFGIRRRRRGEVG
ncbi:MAG TPA: hypothetical protein VFL85_03300 [Candidatus Saccharimonadales bacterium]|nr:hypothetical protein [Candidatus Saccharimonadales bacterium]